MTESTISRRSFLTKSAASTAVMALAQAPAVARRNANDVLNVGCIGTGGRCRALMQSLAKVPGVRLAAVCDVYEINLDLAKKLADPKALVTKQYTEILNRKDIDAVLIGAPDHWHVPMTVAACAAGKDVYVEKPLTHNLEEGSRSDRRTKRASPHRPSRNSAAQHAPVPEGVRNRPLGRHRKGVQGASHVEPQHGPAAERRPEDRRQAGGLEGLSRLRSRPAVRLLPLSVLAMVLGLRQRHPHRFDGAFHRRGALVFRPGTPPSGRRPLEPMSSAKAFGRRRTRSKRCFSTPTICRSISRGLSSMRATAPCSSSWGRKPRCTWIAGVTRLSPNAASARRKNGSWAPASEVRTFTINRTASSST